MFILTLLMLKYFSTKFFYQWLLKTWAIKVMSIWKIYNLVYFWSFSPKKSIERNISENRDTNPIFFGIL